MWLLLAGLLLEPLELVDRVLAGLVEQALLEVGGELDREDAEVARVVELDDGVAGRARGLLVGREQRVLERVDERARLDALLALDLAYRSTISCVIALHPSSIRLPRTIASYGISIVSSPNRSSSARSPAATTSPRKRERPSIGLSSGARRLRPTASRKCAGLRSGRSMPGEETSIE